ELCQNTGFLGATWALRIVRPGVGSPPWQSTHPRTTYGDECISSVPLWHSMQPALFRRASSGLWSIQFGGFGGAGAPSADLASRGTAIGGPKTASGGAPVASPREF